MTSSDILYKRSILFSAKIRFSPEMQPIRDTAIDKIIEQNLLIADTDEGFTLKEIEKQEALCFAGGAPVIHRADMEKSLTRLVGQNRITIMGEDPYQKRYRLSEQTLKELWEVQRTIESRFSKVVAKLFKNVEEGPLAYAAPFLDCLCFIFSQLGETYVRLLKGDLGPDEFLGQPIVSSALKETIAKYRSINKSFFETAIFSFLRDSDPDSDAIKWNMAQNYYVSKAIGLDPSGYLLSKEVFGNSVFYLDTNVLIAALEPKARHHGSFKALSRACQQIQINLNVCQISLDELRRVVERHREILPKVLNQIPEDTAPKVRGVFFELYRDQLTSKGSVNWEEIFASFDNPMEVLGKSYEIELVDDPWFLKAEHQPETGKLSNAMRESYYAKRLRSKSPRSALHDALLLQWIQLKRIQENRNTWLITLTSLPGFLPQHGTEPVHPLAITLDALLQWISPIAFRDDIEDEVAAIFSEAVKYQLLPQESFFDLRDFLVFAEMEWSCKELPAEDVEQCIRYLKVTAPNLDPTTPADREKIAREISKFFADPGRKYKQEIHRIEVEMVRKDQEHKHELEGMKELIRERDEKIRGIERDRIQDEEKERSTALKKSAYWRTSFVILLFLAYELTVLYLSHQYGHGENLFQKVINSWPYLTLGCVLGVGLFWFIVGKERIRVLGWPLTKFLKEG